MRPAPAFELDLDVDLDVDADTEFDTKPDDFRLPKIGNLLPGLETDDSLWSSTLQGSETIFKISEPMNNGSVHVKAIDGVGVVYVGSTGRDMASVQIAYDPNQRAAYKAIVMWGAQYLGEWASQPTVVVALGENPEQIIDRATRGLYACEWGTRLLRDAVARAALVARSQVEDVPTWMVKRAVKELADISAEFAREPDWHWW